MAKFVIIGAGLTGLSTAYHLEQAGCFDYVLFEKEAEIGGLCRSIRTNGFTFDFTGHLLHLNDEYARTVVQNVFPFDKFEKIQRKSHIYSHNTYTNYPFQINLQGLPHDVIVDCIDSFVNRPQYETTPTSFREWVLANFGSGLGKHFFFPYQEKIFDLPIDELSASWTGRFVPATSLREMLTGALGATLDTIGYNASFLYPKAGGIIEWVKGLHDALQNRTYTNYDITSIDGLNNIIHCSNGHEEPFEHLVSTMPLDLLLKRLQTKSGCSLAEAHKNLRCNSVINLNLGISRPKILETHWVYYPEHAYPFYRIGFPSNLTAQMAPTGYSSLSGECSLLQRPAEAIPACKATALTAIKSLFSIHDEEIIADATLLIPHAYVIFDAWRDTHLPSILATLQERYAIESVGRYGAWKYASMQEALLEGKATAEKLLRSV